MSKPSPDVQQQIFVDLQQAEREVWSASLDFAVDEEYEFSRSLAQREFFLNQREQARRGIAERYDVQMEQLREIELLGIKNSWWKILEP